MEDGMVTARYGDETPLGLQKVDQGTSVSFHASFVDTTSLHPVEGCDQESFFPRAKTRIS
jgi:hypothetical protein